MGNWSDYFEDFPEENDANYIDGRYYAPGSQEANNVAHRRRFAQVNAEKVAQEQAALNAEIRAIIKKHTKP